MVITLAKQIHSPAAALAATVLLVLSVVSPASAGEESTKSEEAGKWVKRLVADEDPKEAVEALQKLGLSSVGLLMEAREGAAPQARERIEKVLDKLDGVEDGFELTGLLVDPAKKNAMKYERSDRIVTPSVSDDGGRIALCLQPKGDQDPPKVIVIDREEKTIRSVLDGKEPRLSSNGRIVVFLRPVGEAIRFYANFYTSTASVYLPDTRNAFDIAPQSSDNHYNLTLSRDGLKAAFQARMTCLVHDVRAGADALLRCEGKLPALSPDGRWLARLDVDGNVLLREVGGLDRNCGPPGKDQELLELRALSEGEGVVYTACPAGKPKAARLWGYRPGTGARGLLTVAKGCEGLAVSGTGRILFRTSGLYLKRGLAEKPETLSSRSESAGISPNGHFVVHVKGKTIRVVFVGP